MSTPTEHTTETTDTTETTAPAPTVWPGLYCEDAERLIEWYVRVLGFELTAKYPDGAGNVAHAELAWPEGGGIMLGDARSDDDPQRPPRGSARFYCVASDSRAVHARAVAEGAEFARDLVETEYGDISFSLRDPEGNVVSVGMYPGAEQR